MLTFLLHTRQRVDEGALGAGASTGLDATGPAGAGATTGEATAGSEGAGALVEGAGSLGTVNGVGALVSSLARALVAACI